MTCEVAVFGFTLKPIPYTYLVPEGTTINPGQLIEVPFGKRKNKGIIVATSSDDSSIFDLKPFLRILSDQPVLTPVQLQLARWISETYFISLAEAVEIFLHRIPKKVPEKKFLDNQELFLFPTVEQAISAQKKFSGAVYGPHLPTKEFDQTWTNICTGTVQRVFASRSGVFAPFANLKKITIFQTESDLYKDGRRPYYRTLSVAQELARLTGAGLKAVSYSPRVQDQYLVPHEIKKITQPFSFQVTDLKKHNIINSQLLSYLKSTNPSKTLIFLNRKTNHGSLTCQTCKQTSYTNDPSICPHCGSADIKFKIINLGTLSKKIVEHVKGNFTFSTQQIFFETPSRARFESIVVLSADTYLHRNSYDAGEKTFEMITNLIRLLTPKGKIFIQTAFPNYPAIKLALQHDYSKFYEEELPARRDAAYPPFSQLAKLTYTNSKQTPDKPKLGISIEVLGPFQSKHSYFVARGQNLKALQSLTRPWKLDIDPLSV